MKIWLSYSLHIHNFVAEEIIANLPPLRIPRLRHHRVTDWDPYFENAEGQGINGSQNVALHLGATALLDCRVAMLSGKKVFFSFLFFFEYFFYIISCITKYFYNFLIKILNIDNLYKNCNLINDLYCRFVSRSFFYKINELKRFNQIYPFS